VAPPEDDDPTMAFFRRRYGPISDRTMIEIVQTDGFRVHVIPPNPTCGRVTLFTNAFAADARSACLFMQPPGDFDYVKAHWPIAFFRNLSQPPKH
jgi:hypothetical protein